MKIMSMSYESAQSKKFPLLKGNEKLSARISLVVARVLSSECGVSEIRVNVEWFNIFKKVHQKVIDCDACQR